VAKRAGTLTRLEEETILAEINEHYYGGDFQAPGPSDSEDSEPEEVGEVKALNIPRYVEKLRRKTTDSRAVITAKKQKLNMKIRTNKKDLKEDLHQNEADKDFMKNASMLTEEQKETVTNLIQVYKGTTPRADNMVRNTRMATTMDKFVTGKTKRFNHEGKEGIADFKASVFGLLALADEEGTYAQSKALVRAKVQQAD
jgi:hypothetical protein